MATQVNPDTQAKSPAQKTLKWLKIAGIVLTIFGGAIFIYFIYATGLELIFQGISKVGFTGFAIILFIYLLRISTRATAWRLSVYEPYGLRLKDTLPAVIIGEALSSMIPLGILVSGTAKAVVVRKRVPFVVGLSSVATENLFYSFVTGLFICLGSIFFLRSFHLDPGWVYLIDILIGIIVFAMILGLLMVIRQWHWASAICGWLFERGVLKGILESGRLQVRLFENLIYGFYRRYPRRFVPIILLETAFHTLGIIEVLFILTRISAAIPDLTSAFFLETISRLVTIVFKLVPFVIGVDEAGAELVVEALAIGAGTGVTLAIVRKARIISWAVIGLLLILKRGVTLKDIRDAGNSR